MKCSFFTNLYKFVMKQFLNEFSVDVHCSFQFNIFEFFFLILIFNFKMTVKIVDSLENLIKLTPDVQSILILDRDGVPIVSAGEDIRNRSQYSVSYNTLVEQARKLGMGAQKFWIFRYEMNQVILLSIGQFAVFIMASAAANTGILYTLHTQLRPILDECEIIVKEVNSGQTTTIMGQNKTI